MSALIGVLVAAEPGGGGDGIPAVRRVGGDLAAAGRRLQGSTGGGAGATWSSHGSWRERWKGWGEKGARRDGDQFLARHVSGPPQSFLGV